MDDLFAQLQNAVRGAGSRAERAQLAVDAIRGGTACRWVGIYTVDDDSVVNEAWGGPSAPAHPSFGVDRGLTAHALAAAAVAVSNDVARDPRYLTNQVDSGSELIVPILIDGAPRGTLDVEPGLSRRVQRRVDRRLRTARRVAHAAVGELKVSPR